MLIVPTSPLVTVSVVPLMLPVKVARLDATVALASYPGSAFEILPPSVVKP